MNPNEWIEQFTGIKTTDGSASGPDPLEATAALEQEALMKQTLLADARLRLAGVKTSFQSAMASEVKVKGAIFKQTMLDVKGTQIDEAEFEEIDFAVIDLEPETLKVIASGSNIIMGLGERLAAARVTRNGESQLLFKPRELEDEYWFPLTRERILPETFVGAIYSKTQHMLDETNTLYRQAVEVKREKGELTPKANRVRDLVQSGVQLAEVGASVAGAFGPGSEHAKLAKDVLDMMAKVIEGGGEAYDKLKAREYSDAAGMVLGNIKLITAMALAQAGVPDETIDAVKTGFSAGGAAIKAGKKFAEGIDGAIGGTEILAEVFKGALEIAAGQVDDPDQRKALKLAAVGVSASIKGVAIGGDLVLKLQAGDAAGVADCLTRGAKLAIESSPDLQKLASLPGMSEIAAIVDPRTLVTAAILLKRGQYAGAFDTLVDNIGAGLGKALVAAGLDETQARQICMLYKAGTSAKGVLEALLEVPPNVAAALEGLGAGIESAFAGAAPGNTQLQAAGKGLASGFSGLADAAGIVKLYKEGQFEKGVELFIGTVDARVKSVFDIRDIAQGVVLEDGDDSGEGPVDAPEDVKQKLGGLIGVLGKVAVGAASEIEAHVADAIEDAVKAADKAETAAEVAAILAEAQDDIGQMSRQGVAELSEAEKLSREAADIDVLIAKMQRDRMIMKIAEQVMDGGTAFLATFIPALGAVNAGIKMAASMVAAAQRAQQLYLWSESRKDFAASQNALTSSSRNFVKNQRDQFAHHSIQAAFHAAKLIGNALELAGGAAFGAGVAAGQGLKLASEIGLKLEEIIQRHKKAEELEHGWRVTKAAMKNPTNRKLGLRARALNPTLAKYSIAWGAVAKKDPLARNALRACDLTEAVLDNENANVDKVVEYLEAFYSEDDTLYREVEAAAPWVPTDVTLTLRFWTRLKKLAVENMKLENPDTGNLDGLLVQLKGELAKMDRTATADRVALLKDIDRFLVAYEPKAKKPADVETFRKVILILRKQCAAALKAAETRLLELTRDAEQIAAEEQAAREARALFLADAAKVVGELAIWVGTLESFDSDDELEELQVAFDDATSLVEEVDAVWMLKTNKLVQSTSKQLQSKLPALENLIGIVGVAQAA